VALRWLADRPTVTVPIASARDVDQLAGLLPMQDLVLTDDEHAVLTAASG
jgi:aryl-alcohol dehydrogenase-like predicted oxidoreductase